MANSEIFDSLEVQIIECLDRLVAEADEKKYRGDRIWTSTIKEKLTDLGHELGFDVCPDDSSGAWLFDLCWYLNDSVTKRILRLPLAVESEWNKSSNAIKYDFEKLLVTNAERRLMICQAKPNMIESLFDYFKLAVDDYNLNRTGDRYLIAILNADSEEFYYRLFVK